MEITTIGGFIVLILLIIGIFSYYKFCVPKTEDKEAAKKFISGYKGVFEKTIEKIIDEMDITTYHTIEEFESDIFASAYEHCWDYTEMALQEALGNSAIGSLVAKCVTRESVEEIIKKLIQSNFLQKAEDIYTERVSVSIEEMIAADKAAQIEADLYETGQKEVEPYIEPEPEELDVELNPQRDEEESYSEEDPTQEIIEDTEEVILPLNEEIDENSGEPILPNNDNV